MYFVDNLILHPYYMRIKGNYAVSTLDFVFSVNHDNWTHSTHWFLHALLPNLNLLILKVLESFI